MNVFIFELNHKEQRYNTCGDWYFEGENLVIKVSEMQDRRYSMLIALHEFVEAIACREAGITTEEVDGWDFNWSGEGEPGDHPLCPYHHQHQAASHIERLFASNLGVDWDKYSQAIEELDNSEKNG